MEQVLPHSKLKSLSHDLWLIKGSLPHKNPLPRNMVIFRTKKGELWVHSPVAVKDDVLNDIMSLGKVAWIVVPNDMHRLDAKTWKTTFPDAKVVCPYEARKKVEDEVKVDAVCEDEFTSGEIIAMPMAGAFRKELAYELEMMDGKVLVVNDLLVNVKSLPGFLGKVFKFFGRIGKFRVPDPQKLLFLYQKKFFNKWLEAMAEKNFSMVVVSHGEPVTSHVSAWLRAAARELLH